MASTIENDEVGARLRDLRVKSDLSQRQFADFLGISLRAYQNYERGERRVSADIARKLSEKSGVNPDWLLSGTGQMYKDNASYGAKISPEDGDRFGYLEFFIHPDQLFGDEDEARISSKNIGERGDIQDIIQSIALEPKFVRNILRANPSDIYVVYIEDDAMSPSINRGDIVLINEAEKQVARDGVFAINVNNRVLVRRLQVRPGDVAHIISDNAAFPPYLAKIGDGKEIINDEGCLIQVLGRVIWKGCAV